MSKVKNALVEFLYKITRSRHVIIWLLLHHGGFLLRRGMLLLTMMCIARRVDVIPEA